MRRLSIGKIRGLQQLANEKGIMAMCALDHRGSLMKMLDEKHPERVGYQTMVDFKLDLCRALAPHASALSSWIPFMELVRQLPLVFSPETLDCW